MSDLSILRGGFRAMGANVWPDDLQHDLLYVHVARSETETLLDVLIRCAPTEPKEPITDDLIEDEAYEHSFVMHPYSYHKYLDSHKVYDQFVACTKAIAVDERAGMPGEPVGEEAVLHFLEGLAEKEHRHKKKQETHEEAVEQPASDA